MPSVLVETGFITNPQEEVYLNSPEGQNTIAKCISDAVLNYKSWLEKKQLSSENNTQTPAKESPRSATSFLEAIEQKEKKAMGK